MSGFLLATNNPYGTNLDALQMFAKPIRRFWYKKAAFILKWILAKQFIGTGGLKTTRILATSVSLLSHKISEIGEVPPILSIASGVASCIG